ncbi:MAG: hypothetical protein ACRD7E_00005 [Bryobacteraceae bacterium]
MQCLDCGFEFDEVNESQPVCPCCGADPDERPDSTLGPELVFLDMTADEFRSSARPISVITPGNDLVN